VAIVNKNRVKETTSTTGVGSYSLGGAVLGFQSFATIGDGNSTWYEVDDGTDWEVGIGVYTQIGTSLTRDKILASSNANLAVNWAVGSKKISNTLPANFVSVNSEHAILCASHLIMN
jgi:hypothetical protein